MELVQWIVPHEDGSLAVAWAPVWADRIVGMKGPLRRRGAPLVSRWLAAPLCIGVGEGGAAHEGPARHGKLSLVFAFAVDGKDPRPLLDHHVDDVRYGSVLAELVRVVADLAESAGLPATQLQPTPERTGIELFIGATGVLSAGQLADAVILVRAAVEASLHARGLLLTDARVRVDDKTAPLDGKIASFLTLESSHKKGHR